jgi:hypothetical protein
MARKQITEAKTAFRQRFPNALVCLEENLPERESGAGEGIRTLDPNLGKVVLYP